MITTIGIILFLLSISAHELGHAFAMRSRGVSISEISLLGFGPKLATFKLKRWFGDTPISIGMIPLGAFVRPANTEEINRLSYSAKTHIYGAGVVANMLYAGILGVIAWLITGFPLGGNLTWMILGCLVLGMLPRMTAHLVLPIGIATMIFLVQTFAHMGHHEFAHANGSVVTISQDIHEHSTTLGEMIVYVAFLSVAGLGLTNTLPIFILDGGKIAMALIEKITPGKYWKPVGTVFMLATAIPFFYLVITALAGDTTKIFDFFK